MYHKLLGKSQCHNTRVAGAPYMVAVFPKGLGWVFFSPPGGGWSGAALAGLPASHWNEPRLAW